MKRILIAAALCLVSFQSYAESEMTFKEFGDLIYSEDKSAYFMRYTGTAVKKQGVGWKALNYSAGKYGDANGFRDACLACVLMIFVEEFNHAFIKRFKINRLVVG